MKPFERMKRLERVAVSSCRRGERFPRCLLMFLRNAILTPHFKHNQEPQVDADRIYHEVHFLMDRLRRNE